MSMETWKEEYYPTPAEEFAGTKRIIGAIKHSLRKWKGLRKEALEKHGLIKGGSYYICEDANSFFLIRVDSCSLCQITLKQTDDPNCDKCPGFIATGITCQEDGGCYSTWWDAGIPGLMIGWLEKTLKYWRNKNK